MVWYVIIGTLAAFGALCVLWVLFGALLPNCGGGVIFCLCREKNVRHIARRYHWLRDLGLVRSRLVILSDPETAAAVIQHEWEKIDGSGVGDPPGHRQRGGISEL
ncbi:MAG: hypothetical protein IJ448_04700 [Oscillospiraceae bacterium]|nr:hypothetical protein [Oscillospiraceae bacterium]